MKRDRGMEAMPILSRERFYREREAGCAYLPESSFPASYMSDYSILGLLVDDLSLVIRALEEAGIALTRGNAGCGTVTVGSGSFLKAVQLLNKSGIEYEITDVVHGIYQG